MPSTSKKQHNFMEAIAHSPSFAKKVGVPQSVGQDFAKADKGRKFSQGGHMPMKPGMRGFQTLTAPMMQDRGNTSSMRRGMKAGGMAKSDMKEDMKADLKQDKAMMQKAVNKHEGRLHKGQPMTKLSAGGYTKAADGVAQRGKTKGTMVTMKRGGKC